MQISIIIPTYNEAANIGRLVSYLLSNGNNRIADVIVSDGGSTDNTLQLAAAAGAKALLSAGKGRAAQMNFGARHAAGDVVYFVHADCFPPPAFVTDIDKALRQGYDLGRYRTRFDSSKPLLKLNAWFTRFDFFICMGGDQTLFVQKAFFDNLGGFREDMKIMEEYEFCERARLHGKYGILKGAALISARKYHDNSWLRVLMANARVVKMYRNGASQADLVATYRNMLYYRNNAF